MNKSFKDEGLNALAEIGNVAQFVSFAPEKSPQQRFSRVRGCKANHRFASLREAIEVLLVAAPERRINLRTFRPGRPEGNPFIRELSDVDEIISRILNLACEQGFYVIANEAIDIHDGGVSGVMQGGQIEFAPDATPRCVDDPEVDTAELPTEVALRMLQAVYGVPLSFPSDKGARIEFSVHPGRRGWKHEHSVIWQWDRIQGQPELRWGKWPHAFSRMLGDKAYGLVVADSVGLLVPRTLVF